MPTVIREGDTIMLTSADVIEDHWVRPHEFGEYLHTRTGLVRVSDGYVIVRVIADPDEEC